MERRATLYRGSPSAAPALAWPPLHRNGAHEKSLRATPCFLFLSGGWPQWTEDAGDHILRQFAPSGLVVTPTAVLDPGKSATIVVRANASPPPQGCLGMSGQGALPNNVLVCRLSPKMAGSPMTNRGSVPLCVNYAPQCFDSQYLERQTSD